MVDLTEIQRTTRIAIESFQPEVQKKKQFTYRLGMSGIGTKCSRRLQYVFHNCFVRQQPEPRIRRLFQVGNLSEQIIIDMLAEVGIKVTDQQAPVHGFHGHAFGFIDGIAHDVVEAPKTPHLAEFKTHNDKNFKLLVKQGVRVGYKEHYDQCQRYMLEKKLTRAIYIGYNKNDSDVYIERIEFNKPYADDLYRKEAHVILATDLDPRLEGKDDYQCTYCPAKAVCLSGAPVHQNCRTCSLVEKCEDGKWECTHHLIELSRDQQNEGCASWRIDDMFISDLTR